MKTKLSFGGTPCAASLLLLLLLLMLPAAALAADYNYATINGTIKITWYTGPGGDVVIPDTINNLPVTGIANAAFYFIGTLTSVTIPSSITNIEVSAFTVCTNVTAFTVDVLNPTYCSAEGVLFDKSTNTLIQFPAGKSGSYTIPNTVSSIGAWAFECCTRLTDISIPSSVTSIAFSEFNQCSSLTAITVDALNAVYSSVDGVLFNHDKTTLIQCPGGKAGSYSVPSGVATIGSAAFVWCAALTSITIPSSVASIGSSAFVNCGSLAGVYFNGNAPGPGTDSSVFQNDTIATVYFLPGTSGWGATFDGRPTKLWNPLAQTTDASFGVQTNQFGFNITGTANIPLVVEACTDLSNPVWTPLRTNTLTTGSIYFSDPDWTNYPTRFYRLRSP